MKKAFLLILLFSTQVICIAQINNWENKYTISDDSVNYKFEIIKYRNYYTIKYYCDSAKKEISYNDTIESLKDSQVLKNSVKKLIQNNTSLKNPDYNLISSSLYKQDSIRHLEREKNSEKEFIDNIKGEKVGIISSKVGPSSSLSIYSIKKANKTRKYLRVNDLSSLKDLVKDTIKDTMSTQQAVKPPIQGTGSTTEPSETANTEKRITIEKITIDSIDIAFNQGIIQNINVRATLIDDKGKELQKLPFSNKFYIPVRNAEDIDMLSTKEAYFLTCVAKKNSVLLLDLADVIEYNRRIPFSSGTYIPKDTTIYIVPGEISRASLYKPSLSENFDIKVFTDLVGYNSDAPNGIIQTEAQVDFTLKTAKRKVGLPRTYNRAIKAKNSHQYFCLGRISPYFILSRIENSKSPFYIDTKQRVDLLDLFKYSHLNVGTELNIATYRTNSKFFTVNMAGGIFRTKIGYDSIEQNNFNKSTIYMNPNLNLYFFESGHLDFNLRFGVYAAWTVKDINSTNLNMVTESIKKYTSDITNYWGQFQQSINIHPNAKKSNSIFFRSSQYLGDDNNYFSFQLGYSTTLGSLLNMSQ